MKIISFHFQSGMVARTCHSLLTDKKLDGLEEKYKEVWKM
jgi:hypothetical protein